LLRRLSLGELVLINIFRERTEEVVSKTVRRRISEIDNCVDVLTAG